MATNRWKIGKEIDGYRFHMPLSRALSVFKRPGTVARVVGLKRKTLPVIKINGKKYLRELHSLRMEKLLGGKIRCDIIIMVKK